jgi:hypothetical protein
LSAPSSAASSGCPARLARKNNRTNTLLVIKSLPLHLMVGIHAGMPQRGCAGRPCLHYSGTVRAGISNGSLHAAGTMVVHPAGVQHVLNQDVAAIYGIDLPASSIRCSYALRAIATSSRK